MLAARDGGATGENALRVAPPSLAAKRCAKVGAAPWSGVFRQANGEPPETALHADAVGDGRSP